MPFDLPPIVYQIPCPKAILNYFLFPFGSIIKTPPVNAPVSTEIPYEMLTCTEEDREKITFLITTMAENGKLSLLFRARELRRLGDEIAHVHPFRFLGVVFANQALKVCMQEIYTDYFKWSEFINGLTTSLTAQADRGKLECYLNDFAKEISLPPDSLKGYLQSREWEEMVHFLMK